MKPDNIIPLPTDKPSRSDALRNRRLLLDTAQRLFEENNIADVTMSAIAKAAQVGKGTLYRHFNDKADLCHALLDHDMRDFQHHTLQTLRKTQDPVEALQWFLKAAAHYIVDHIDLLCEASNQSGVDMLRHPAHIWWQQTIIALLERIQPEGDLAYIADVLYIMLDVQSIRFQHRIQGYELERIVAGLHMTIERLISISNKDRQD